MAPGCAILYSRAATRQEEVEGVVECASWCPSTVCVCRKLLQRAREPAFPDSNEKRNQRRSTGRKVGFDLIMHR